MKKLSWKKMGILSLMSAFLLMILFIGCGNDSDPVEKAGRK